MIHSTPSVKFRNEKQKLNPEKNSQIAAILNIEYWININMNNIPEEHTKLEIEKKKSQKKIT